jgi:tripartite-type tricarboxylate transporter receptor subunit TctC
MITRLILLWAIAAPAVVAAGVCVFVSAPASAQTYPSRPVKVIVPFAPGGVDVTARVVTERLSAALGQPFIVENRPGGAGGSVGAKAVASAEPDGYTLLFSTPGPSTIGPAINRNAGYVTANFSAVALVSMSPIMLVVNASLPVKSVPELIAYAKANPGKIHYASPGYGTQPHLLGEMLKGATGADIVHVPYRGSAPAITDLIAGQVQIYFDNVPNLLQHVAAGTLRALALTTSTRDPLYPQLPTMAESGQSGLLATYWNGVLAPAGTPPSVIARLNGAINQGLKSADTQAALRKLGAEPKSATPQEFGAFLAAEAQLWAAVAKAADIKVD